jgi:hypothetical protein
LQIFSEHVYRVGVYLNANMIDPSTATLINDVLQNALNVLKKRAAASTLAIFTAEDRLHACNASLSAVIAVAGQRVSLAAPITARD